MYIKDKHVKNQTQVAWVCVSEKKLVFDNAIMISEMIKLHNLVFITYGL